MEKAETNHATLRRYVRHKKTRLYLTESGRWTADIANAANWPSLTAMENLCQKFALTDVEAVLKFKGEDYDCVIPLCPNTSSETPPAGS